MSLVHAVVLPVVLPLTAGACLSVLEPARPRLAASLSLLSVLVLAALAILLVVRADAGRVDAYLLGNWPAPFGIVLAVDRLGALMLLLTALIALPSLLAALAHESPLGRHFHALFQFQMAGLNGAFLTADLFNLFVFFELLLIASYGLLLSGDSATRLHAAMHYIVVNLCASLLFLVALALVYGLTGTLNMADLAQRLASAPALADGPLCAALLLLMLVFAVKAALLPFHFWLPRTYSVAAAPVAALFAVMTKVGVYAIARLASLLHGDGADVMGFAPGWLTILALATLIAAAQGGLSARYLRSLTAWLLMGSTGLALAGVSLASETALAAALYYVLASTLSSAALFLFCARLGQARDPVSGAGDTLQPAPLTAEARSRLGGIFLLLAIAAAGMPPLGSFLGKVWVLQAAIGTPLGTWVLGVVLLTSLAALVALMRAGSALFWCADTVVAAHRHAEGLPVHGLALPLLLAALVVVGAAAAPVARYTSATAEQLYARAPYIEAVLSAQPVPPLWNLRAGGVP